MAIPMIHSTIRVMTFIFFVFILWIIFLANTGESSVFFNFVRALPYGDKLGHFCLFGTLTLGATIAFKFKSISLGGCPIYWGTLIVTVFVILEELSQGLVASRTLDIIDLLADGVGIAVFTAISYYLSRKFPLEDKTIS